MTIEEIKELLRIFTESGIAELELQRGDNRLRLKRAGVMSQEIIVPAQMPVVTASAPAPAAPPALSAARAGFLRRRRRWRLRRRPKAIPVDIVLGEIADRGHVLTNRPRRVRRSFVRVGDAVEPGQVLCIIEAMKLMNEIESEVAGVVAAKLVENGRPVEYGEALFAIRPR